MKHITNTNGFTLFEMVVVIVILGILAATAAPRFLSTSTDAKIASLDGFVGAFRAVESIVEGKLAMEGKDMMSQDIVTSKDGIEAQFGSIVLSQENLKRVMDTNGYRIVTCLEHQQMLVVPSTYKQVPDGANSSEACTAAMKTWCWVSLYNPLLVGGHGELSFDIGKNYKGC